MATEAESQASASPCGERRQHLLPNKWKNVLLRVAAVYIFVMGSLSLRSYIVDAYLPFVTSGDSAPVYLASALRMTCRLGYPIAGIAIFFRHRWGLWLLVTVWLAQLLPSSVYAMIMRGDLSGHVASLIEFIVTIGFLCLCRSALKHGKIGKPILLFFASALALHTALFLAIHRAPASAPGNTKEPGGVDRKRPAGDDSLIAAVYRGDEQAVKKHLSNPETVKRELDPVCPQFTRCKPITFAVENGNLAILKMLLDAGADPDGATSYGDTPLIIAILSNHQNAIDLLLQYKADVNKTNRFRASAFTGAAAMGDVELVEKFIRHGADIDKTFPFNNPATSRVQGNTTPLAVAVQMGHAQVVKLLLRNKANPHIQDSLGKSAADYANASENAEIKEAFWPSTK